FEPIASYHYRPSPQMHQNDLYYFDELDKLADLDYFDFSLINRIQIKKKHEDITRGKDSKLIKTTSYTKKEILYWNVGTRYDQNIHTTHRFSDISSDLRVNFTDRWGMRIESGYDMYKDDLSSISGDIEYKPTDKLSTSFGVRYNNDTDRYLWENSARWEINKKWAVEAYNMYDVERSAWEKQEFSIWHNMCCWDVEFIVSTRNRSDSADETSFFISFNLSAYRDGNTKIKGTAARF
ncbi:LPS assembly protein LptD, partial [bacterium]|nr:LPS assembly protein LptD [bacterium]